MSRFHKKTLQEYLQPNQNGWTPLHDAAVEGHLDQVVSTLQASGEKLSLDHILLQNSDVSTPLHYAAWHGHIDQVQAALQASGEKLLFDHFLIEDKQGWTPLLWAEQARHIDQVFNPSYWTGRVGEMMRLWDQVPPERKQDIDFEALRNQALELTVRSVPKIDPEAFFQAKRAGAPLSPEATQKIAEL